MSDDFDESVRALRQLLDEQAGIAQPGSSSRNSPVQVIVVNGNPSGSRSSGGFAWSFLKMLGVAIVIVGIMMVGPSNLYAWGVKTLNQATGWPTIDTETVAYGSCPDIVDSLAAGVSPDGNSWQSRTKRMMGKAVLGAQFWTDGHSGGVDILGVHMTPVRLPQAMTYYTAGFYDDENRYGEFRQFRWVSADGKQDLMFYFGHLEDSPTFRQGEVYPTGTIVGYMTDGGQYASRWLYFHTHMQIEPTQSIDGAGDVDPEEWWKQNCSAVAASGDPNVMTGSSSISAERIDEILASWNSPAVGTGVSWVKYSKQYNLDAAHAIAFFVHESGAGTNPRWAGWKGNGLSTHNVGNIICTGSTACYGRFRDYDSWDAGIEDWFKLLATEYTTKGLTTVATVIPVYAPSFENDVPAYVNAVTSRVTCYRSSQAAEACK